MPTRIDAELGLNAKKFISGMAQATAALEAFKSKSDFAGSSIAISISKASDTAAKGAREIKTELSDSAQEIAEALRNSGTTSERWVQGVTDDMRAASKAFSATSDRVVTSMYRASNSLKRGFGVGVVSPALYSDLRLLDKDLRTISVTSQSTAKSLSRVGTTAAKLPSQISKISTAQAGMIRSSRGASAGLIEFSRLIGDAPYGIRGMANNLQQMAFVMGASGPFLLAITVATAALDYFIGGNRRAKKETEELEEGLNSLSQAFSAGEKSAYGEIAALQTLISIAEDEARSRKERLIAVNNLQDKYPSILGNLTDEQILVGDVGDAYKELAVQLRNVALAQAFQSRETEVFGKIIDSVLAQKEQLEVVKQERAERAKVAAEVLKGEAGINDIMKAQNELADATTKYNELILDQQASQKDLNDLTSLREELVKKVNAAMLLGEDSGGRTKARKEIDAITASFWRLEKGITDIYSMSIGTRMAAGLVNISQQVQGIASGVTPVFASQGEILADAFNEGFNKIIGSGIAEAISSMASGLGEAIANGGNLVQAAGGALLGALGGILVELGKMAIGVGVGIAAIKKALATLNPAVAIGAGVALVAIGSAFAAGARNLAGNIGGSGGGTSSNNTGSNTTTISGANVSGIQGTVVFEIAGRSLVGILKREAIHGNRITP